VHKRNAQYFEFLGVGLLYDLL